MAGMEYHPVDHPYDPPYHARRILYNVRDGGGGIAHQGLHRLAWVWPKDGKRMTTWGRWKDIFTNRGPDIFLSTRGSRPTRACWSRWNEFDRREDDSFEDFPWARRTGEVRYDFLRRKYCRPNRTTWSDVRWPRGFKDSDFDQPSAYRCAHGQWYQIFPRQPGQGGAPLPGWTYQKNRKGW